MLIRLVIVGAGDVAHRHYLPALRSMGGEVELVAFVDQRGEAGERAVAASRDRWPGVVTVAGIDDLAGLDADAAVNLTPAPVHGETNHRLLEAGLHVYSEKPIARALPARTWASASVAQIVHTS